MAEGKIRIKDIAKIAQPYQESDSEYCKNSRSECNNCIECDPWKNGKSIKKDKKKDRGDPG